MVLRSIAAGACDGSAGAVGACEPFDAAPAAFFAFGALDEFGAPAPDVLVGAALDGGSWGVWLGMGASLSRMGLRRYRLAGSVDMAGILHVCLANRCRSPLAEALTRRELAAHGAGPALTVGSAGIRARPGLGLWPAAEQEARARGLPVEGFASRSLTPAMLAGADLVLAATRALRDEVIAMHPQALRRTFTWRELAWLLGGVGPQDLAGADIEERLRALATLAGSQRGRRSPPAPQDLDVEDPVAREPAFLPVAVDQIAAATAVWVHVLDYDLGHIDQD